jgi:hypothetical protein
MLKHLCLSSLDLVLSTYYVLIVIHIYKNKNKKTSDNIVYHYG